MNNNVTKAKDKKIFGERIYIFSVYLIVLVFAACCVIPFWLVVGNSFNDTNILNTQGYQLIITHFNLDAYKYLLTGKQIFQSYGISIVVTISGTILATLITAMYAYVLSHRRAKYGNIMSFLTYFTMIVGSGLVGFYLLVGQWLHLKDTLFALILPYLLNPFLAFVMVNFYRSLPYDIYESATVDGANDIFIFFRIIFPVSIPGIASIALFYSLQYWNDWWLSILFIEKDNLNSLQMMLHRLLSDLNASQYVMGSTAYITNLPTEAIKLATVAVTIGPIIIVYPFIQRYFVKGMTIGAVKG